MATAFERVIIKMAVETIDKALSIDMPTCKFCQSNAAVYCGYPIMCQYQKGIDT